MGHEPDRAFILKAMEQRKYQRFPLNCRLVIQGNNRAGQRFCETTELINISGGGALFYSRQPEQYVTGQTVEANILLPGTPDLQGAMHTTARIMEVGNRIVAQKKQTAGASQVAIHFLEPFQILRGEKAEQFRQDKRQMS